MDLLTRYWFKFGDKWIHQVGVTAYSEDDATALIESQVFGPGRLPEIVQIVVNIDVSTLDAGHILPNIGVPSRRGIWFPNLNSS